MKAYVHIDECFSLCKQFVHYRESGVIQIDLTISGLLLLITITHARYLLCVVYNKHNSMRDLYDVQYSVKHADFSLRRYIVVS